MTCFQGMCGEDAVHFGYDSEVFVWLINHICRQVASYVGTGISEADQSLGKPEMSVVP